MKADLEQVREWLYLLHDESPGRLHVCAKGDWTGLATADRDEVTAYVQANDHREGVYLRCTTLAEGAAVIGRGHASDSVSLPGLWADLDLDVPGHQPTPGGLPLLPDWAAARAVVAHLPEPTLWVFSGGGLYPWWLLYQPHVIFDDHADVQALSTAWHASITKNAEAAGFCVGGTGDLARVLRIPGTINRKAGLERPCEIIERAGRRYALDELRAALPAPKAVEPPSMTAVKPADVYSETFAGLNNGLRPGDDYNARGTFRELLERHGWTLDRVRSDGVEEWRRPGKDEGDGISATVGYGGDKGRFLWVFSTSTPFTPLTAYSLFSAYTLLEHSGDFSAAARALRAAGYGDQTPAPGEQTTAPAVAEPVPERLPTGLLTPALMEELNTDRSLREVVGQLLRQARAKEIVAEIEVRKNPKPAPDMGNLGDLLARDDDDVPRIEGLLPAQGRLLVSAMRKTGKTTFVGNLSRSLLTGDPFLDRFPVTKLDGRVVVLNYEVTGKTFSGWMDDIGVPRHGMFVVNLRGKRNLLRDAEGREELVDILRAQECELFIVDPFGRAFTGKNQNDTGEVTPWLVMLDEVATNGGAAELVLTAHTGWDGERTRGSSGLEDWPDSIVWLKRDKDTAERFLSAEGRDVLVDEDRLHFDKPTRHLSMSGEGSRKQVRDEGRLLALADSVRGIVARDPGINVSALREALRGNGLALQREDANKAASLAVDKGWVRREKGARGAWQHFPVSGVPTSPEASRGPVTTSPDPSYRDGTGERTAQASTGPEGVAA